MSRAKIIIQYVSDLHLEFLSVAKVQSLLDHIIPKTDICVLAGDIGYPFAETYTLFLKGINKKFKNILLIHGNHEYYQLKENKGKTMNEIINKTRNIIQENRLDNIHFLHNSHYDIKNYRFIGSTLWTYIYDPKYVVNDAYNIGEFTVENNNNNHSISKEFLKLSIEQCQTENKTPIVITHHIPSFTLTHPKYKEFHLYSQCYSSACDDLVSPPVKCWIYGHTHTPMVKIINNIPCICNPIGYSNENESNEIDYNRYIVIDGEEDENI